MPKYKCKFHYPAALDLKHPERAYQPGEIYEPSDDAENAFMAESHWFEAVVDGEETASLETAKADLEDKVKTLEADKTKLEGDKKTLEEKVKTLEAEVAGLKKGK